MEFLSPYSLPDRPHGSHLSVNLPSFFYRAVVATHFLVSAAALGVGRGSTATRPAHLDTTEKPAWWRAAAATELTVTQSQVPVCVPLGSW